MFGRENSSPTTTVSCESTEVFRKEELRTRAMDEKRGKQKRRDRVFKTKTHNSAKTKVKGGNLYTTCPPSLIHTPTDDWWGCPGTDKG
jgi:DNA polymerase sigma